MTHDTDAEFVVSYEAFGGFPYHVIPFFVAVAAFILCRQAGIPEMVAPIVAGMVSMVAACHACIGTRGEKAVLTVACGLANVGMAFLVFPWLLGRMEAAMGAWVAASDLLLAAFFGTDHLIRVGRFGRTAKTIASGVAFQSGLLVCMFLWPRPSVITVLSAVYVTYAILVHTQVESRYRHIRDAQDRERTRRLRVATDVAVRTGDVQAARDVLKKGLPGNRG